MQVYKTDHADMRSQISFIYNRFDLFHPLKNYDVWCYEYSGNKVYFEVSVYEEVAALGIWLLPLSGEILQEIVSRVFKAYPKVRKIEYQYSLAAIGDYAGHPSYEIELPDSEEALDLRLSSKGRYNQKRSLRLLGEQYGEVTFMRYDARDPKAAEVWDRYFEFKQRTHGTSYHLTPDEYCDKYHVTDIYALFAEGEIISMILSCEQCDIVYLDNLSYNPEYSKYSPGQILYSFYLKQLIQKGKVMIYLGGGDLEYKKRYGSIKKTVYDGVIYRNAFWKFVKKIRKSLAYMSWYRKLSKLKSGIRNKEQRKLTE